MSKPVRCGPAETGRLQEVRGGSKSVSVQQAHQLRHRQRHNAEHQVAQHLGVTSQADLASAELVPESSSGQALETTLDTLDGGALTVA